MLRFGTTIRRGLLAVTLICAAASARSQAEWPSLRVMGQIGGPTIAVAAGSNIVLAASGYRVVVYDASDPGALREIGSSPPFGDFVRGIALGDGRATIAAGSSGMHVIDLTDPRNPVIVGAWDSPGSAEGVAVVGTTAYLADGPFGLRILDVSNASNPHPIGSAFDDSFAFDVAISGTTAVIAAGGGGVRLADVSDPRAPIELAGIDTPGYARGVAIADKHAVIADQWEGARIVDISKRIDVGSLATGSWAFDVAVSGSIAFMATGSAGLVTIDLANPAAPRTIGTLPVPNGDSVAVAASGNRAFLAAGRAGLQVVDVTDHASPRLVQALAALGDGLGVAAASPYVYVAGGGGFVAIDATDPSRPRQLGSFRAGDGEFGTYVATAAGYAYLGGSGQLVAVDVSDPSHPVETSRVDAGPAAFRQMSIRDTLLLAATEWDLSIFDITQKSAPVLRARLPMYTGPGTQQAVGVATTGRYALVAHDKAGMAVVDLINPAAPVVISHYGADSLFGVAAIAASNDYAYVPKCGQLEVVSIANPTNPQRVGFLSLKGCPYRATLTGNTLYLAAGSEGVFEIDVSNPFAPVIVSRTVLPGSPQEVAVSNAWLAVSVLKLGLFLLGKGSSATSSVATTMHRELPRPDSGPMPVRVVASHAVDVRPTAGRQIVVNSPNDAGTGTLRDAIGTAVAGDVITFDAAVFPPAAPVAIRPLSALPCVHANITIDASNAGVVLDGSMLSESALISGIYLCSRGAVIKGLQIIDFPGSGIAVGGTDNLIGGDRGRGAGPVGEGNLCSGNRAAGIDLGGEARRNRIVGNLVGATPPGFTLRFQQSPGVFFARASENVVGGSSEAERNVISGNHVDVGFIVAGHNALIGNYIGTDVTGTNVAPNLLAGSSEIGVSLEGGSHDNLIAENVIASGQAVAIADAGSHYNRILRNRIGIGPNGARIAGEVISLGSGIGVGEAYNLIAGNVIGGLGGAAIHTTAPSDVYILGNLVGTDPSGTIPIPNTITGGSIRLQGARRAFVGGSSATDGNLIRGNLNAGIELRGPGNEQNFIVGNSIIANGDAGIAASASQQNFIQRNILSANPVGIRSTGGSVNRLRRNSIFDNSSAGIEDLTARSPAPPVILQTAFDFVSGVACAGCLIEVFSDAGDEGRWFEGETVAASDGRFTMRKSTILRGPRVSATATDGNGASSVFSATMQIPPRPPRRRAVRH